MPNPSRFWVRLQDGAAHYLRVYLIRLLHPSPDRFGAREALCFSNTTDEWIRLSSAARHVREGATRHSPILDLGSGLTSFANLLPSGLRVVQVDRRFRGVRAELGRARDRVKADAACLPFRTSAFEVVASVDMVEHVPKAARSAVLSELGRVAARRVVIHCPAVSADGSFAGRTDDEAVDAWLRARYGRGDPNLDEHLEAGHPSIEELQAAFPAARVEGTEESSLWIETMKASRVPLLGLVASLRYKKAIARPPQGGPYHSCLLEWTKP